MSDKRMSNKKFFKNRNKNRGKGNNRNVPSPICRLDDDIIREVSLMLELGGSDDLIRKQYNICSSQIDYIRNNKKPLQTLEQMKLEEKNRKKWGE